MVYDGTSAGSDTSFNNGSLSSLSANWSGFDTSVSNLDHYDISAGTAPAATDVANWTSTGTTASGSVTGSLRTGVTYYLTVRVVDTAGNTSSVVSSDGQQVAPTLSFGVSPSTVTFADLDGANSYTDTQTVLTTSTNSYGGYVVRTFAAGQLRTADGAPVAGVRRGELRRPRLVAVVRHRLRLHLERHERGRQQPLPGRPVSRHQS